MAVLSLMLAYVELQTPPPARTATVTDDISPGIVTGPLGGPTGPRWDGGPVGGLIKLEVSLLGGSGLCRYYRRTQTAGWL